MRTAVLLSMLCLTAPALAQEVTIAPNDTIQSLLTKQKPHRVTVRLRSGQELTGTVRDATSRLVVLGSLSGREFFDAVVPLESVEAVLIRTKQ